MSEFSKTSIGKTVQSLDVSPQFAGYSGVEIATDEESHFFKGDETGRVLRVENPWGTEDQCRRMYNLIKGFSYQPYTAMGAIINPAAEIGDGVTINDTYSGIYKLSKRFGPLIIADLEAPQDEEIDHEFPYESRQDRIYRREVAEARAQISINQNDIALEVTRATDAERDLSTAIQQSAAEITASVVAREGGTKDSFEWVLNSTSWTLKSGGSQVFKATKDGIDVKGKITATSGFIGNGANGFTITGSAIYNGMSSLGDTTKNGVYIGTDGIALGKGSFKVTSSGGVTAQNLTITGGSIKLGANFSVSAAGNITANNATLTGTLTIGGTKISAETLRKGAQEAAANYGTWNGTTTSWGYATTANTAIYPEIFTSRYLLAKTNITAPYADITTDLFCADLKVGAYRASWKSKTVVTNVSTTGAYVNGTLVVTDVAQATSTIYYLGREQNG